MGWGVFRVEGKALASCLREGIVVRFVCLWQWLGKGFHALHGVDVKWCPRAGHGALPVTALEWAGYSRGLGALVGTYLGASRPSSLDPFLGGSQWAHPPHVGPFPLLGAGPLTSQREGPLRGSYGHGAVCGE